MTRWGIVLVVVCAGCGDDAAQPDALQLADAAPPDAPSPDAAPDAPSPACTNPATDAGGGGTYTVYLNAEGVTLTKGNCDNATTNCTNIIMQSQAVVPPFMNGAANRDAVIAEIAAHIEEVLLPYSIDVVTTRPAAGPYYMIVLGGDCTLTAAPPCQSTTGVGVLACNDLSNRDHISLVFEETAMNFTAHQYANEALAWIVLFSGIGATTMQNDCGCLTCGSQPVNADCSLGRNVPTWSNASCNAATQDEQMAFKSAFGCR